MRARRGRLGRVGVVLGGILLGVSQLCGWFVDGELMTFGPRGYVHCYDVPCSALEPRLPIELGILGALTLVTGLIAAVALVAARRPPAIRLAARLWLASLCVAAVFAADALVVHGSTPWRSAPEVGTIWTIGLPLFSAATLLVLCGFARRGSFCR